MEVRTRIAPSPTGDPHVGTAYIALFNYVFAHHMHGKFILRIEDTDKSRSLPIFEENIYKALKWCNLSWEEGPDIGGDFGPYRQSERLTIYKEHIQILLDKNMAYKCFATEDELKEMREIAKKTGQKYGYDRRYRNLSKQEVLQKEKEGQKYVVRLKMPLSGKCVFTDEIKGKITCPWSDVDDQILMKSDGYPTYHFANVVDDHLMKISHVIRGDEWLSSMPKHIFLYKAFGWQPPIFIHMPLLLGKEGKKLSKRKNPTSIFFYRDSGYLPEALMNFLSLMGYSMPNDMEFYPIEQLISLFDIKRIGLSGAFFDIKKLQWINQKYIIEKLSEKDLLTHLKNWQFNDTFFKKLLPLTHTRIRTLGDFFELCDFFFINHLNYTQELLCPKGTTNNIVKYLLQTLLWHLDEKPLWDKNVMEKASHVISNAFSLHHKKIVMPILFVSIMGKKQGLPLFSSVEILGKERTRARLLEVIEYLGGISNKKLKELKKCWEKKDCSSITREIT